jgi:integrase
MVRVRRAVVEVEHGFAVDEPKTKGSRRSVEIPPGVVSVLKEHRQRQLEERLAARSWEDESLVFPNARGSLLNRYRLGHHFRKIREAAGVDPRHQFRDFRHTFATLLFARGYHPKKVQEAMGHRSIRLTLDTYSHWVPSMGGTADALEDVF